MVEVACVRLFLFFDFVVSLLRHRSSQGIELAPIYDMEVHLVAAMKER